MRTAATLHPGAATSSKILRCQNTAWQVQASTHPCPLTSSQHFSQTLRQVKGRSHTQHNFWGKFSLATPRGIAQPLRWWPESYWTRSFVIMWRLTSTAQWQHYSCYVLQVFYSLEVSGIEIPVVWAAAVDHFVLDWRGIVLLPRP